MHSIFDDCLTADASLNGSWTEFFKKKAGARLRNLVLAAIIWAALVLIGQLAASCGRVPRRSLSSRDD